MLPRFKKFLLKLWHKAFCEDIARVKILFFLRNIGGHTDGLTDMCRCRHDACGRESNVCCADKPSSKEQVFDILTIKTTVRNLVHTFGMPLVTTRLLTEH